VDETIAVNFNGILNGSWKWEMKQFSVNEWEGVLIEMKREKEQNKNTYLPF
jgi:hypothetical protein